jgi:hypothetical protein
LKNSTFKKCEFFERRKKMTKYVNPITIYKIENFYNIFTIAGVHFVKAGTESYLPLQQV